MAYQMKDTVRGYNYWEMLSYFQKCIRRGLEEDAMWVFYEMEASGYFAHVANRLLIIAHEDISTGDLEAVERTHKFVEYAKELYSKNKEAWALPISNAILMLCRADKTREADNFHAYIKGVRVSQPDIEIPDWAIDQFTRRGKAMGRGAQHFKDESAKLGKSSIDDKGLYYEQVWDLWMKEDKGVYDFSQYKLTQQQIANAKGLFPQ